MARAGKRRRPILLASVHDCLAGDGRGDQLESVQGAAVAVECFHKASLVHDDIEDSHTVRYRRKTLHTEYGVAIALNVGDFLIGEGYRLLSELDVSDARKAALLLAASRGHRALCLGQGSELFNLKSPEPPSVEKILGVFRNKTSPAFEVALKVGAVLGGADDKIMNVLGSYAGAIGVAYQIKDDIDDFNSGSLFMDPPALRSSLLLSVAWGRCSGGDRSLLERVWAGTVELERNAVRLRRMFANLEIEGAVKRLFQTHLAQAGASLADLENRRLKSLLETFLAKVAGVGVKLVCCDEHRRGHAGGRTEGC
jgi:geranylgeranyl pyrophosphate synthase